MIQEIINIYKLNEYIHIDLRRIIMDKSINNVYIHSIILFCEIKSLKTEQTYPITMVFF